MNIIRTNRKTKKTKKCKHPWCNIQITNSISKEQCTDPECIKKRKELKEVEKEFTPTLNKNNIVFKRKIPAEKTVKFRCCAKGRFCRCSNYFVVTLRTSQKVYPKFCESHRNEYRRKRFETKG